MIMLAITSNKLLLYSIWKATNNNMFYTGVMWYTFLILVMLRKSGANIFLFFFPNVFQSSKMK